MNNKKPAVSKARDLASLTGRSVGTLGPAAVNIIGGLMNGNLAQVASGTAQATGFFIKEAADAVKDRGSKASDRLGMQMIRDIAERGSTKGAESRVVWKRLLANAMDENYTGEFRQSHLDMLSTMISPDMVLLYILGHFRDQMAKDVAPLRAQIQSEIRKDSEHPMRDFIDAMEYHGTTYDLIRKYWKTAFNADLHVTDEELGYALRDQNEKVFEVVALAIMPHGAMLAPVKAARFTFVGKELYGGLIIARLSEPAERLARLLGDPNKAESK